MPSTDLQARLWGARARDFGEICEPLSRPLYEATLAALRPLHGVELLDVGCGTGLALQLAAGHGARTTGLDAAQPMIDLARERMPRTAFHVTGLEALPFADASFDVVTAFNAIQYAAEPSVAVAQMTRVARPHGRIAIGVWAEPARCETDVLFQRIRALAPAPPGVHAPLAISTPGTVEKLLDDANLVQTAAGEVSCPFVYPDLATAWRGQSSIGPFRRAIELAGEATIREAFTAVMDAFRQPDGTYRQENVFRYVIAAKP